MNIYLLSLCVLIFFFFFQAEDGIRDVAVTGVQTCALPISNIRQFEVSWILSCVAIKATCKNSHAVVTCITTAQRALCLEHRRNGLPAATLPVPTRVVKAVRKWIKSSSARERSADQTVPALTLGAMKTMD